MNSATIFLKNLFLPSQFNKIFLVGGTVRDALLGREPQDIDLVAALSHKELLNLGFSPVETSIGASIYFKHLPATGKIEITRINSVAELSEELCRRDFTINAVAMNLDSEYIDPLNGRADLNGMVLRVCSDKSFTSDPLRIFRIFRAFRFESNGWRLTQESEALINSKDWSSELSSVPIERFTLEMMKAFLQEKPERFFERMIEFRVGIEMLPELFLMTGIPAGSPQHHPEGDLFTHSVQVLQRVSANTNDQLSRFCAFFHDIGKLATNPALYPKHHEHDSAGFNLAVDFCNRLKLSSLHRKTLAWTSALHSKANLWNTLRNQSRLKIAEQALKGSIVDILPLVSAADKTGSLPMDGWKNFVKVAAMSSRDLGINQEKLEALLVKNRPSVILQKRLELLAVMN
ncbi:MAG: HD domain-containing protein [Desulfuromonadaceae bacterium]|nr:HD domain-containing protein [Desulfuromonadaceae bacterium]MDD2854054.1 HD domain-containing protein [Desulfuromonadaceae bacterium]